MNLHEYGVRTYACLSDSAALADKVASLKRKFEVWSRRDNATYFFVHQGRLHLCPFHRSTRFSPCDSGLHAFSQATMLVFDLRSVDERIGSICAWYTQRLPAVVHTYISIATANTAGPTHIYIAGGCGCTMPGLQRLLPLIDQEQQPL